jgi:peptide/nickel transport system substrate-binding protein
MHLRRGARFSDGRPITSGDVLFSFEIAYDPKLHPATQDLLMVGGKPMTLEAIDSFTVAIHVPARYALFLPAIGAVSILPRHVLEGPFREGTFAAAYGTSTKPESLITSGPFRLKQYVPNEKTVLSPNPYWYGVDAEGRRLPYLDEVVLLIVPDLNTASLQFESGVLDALDLVQPQDYARYFENQRKGNFTLYDLGPMLAVSYLVFNQNLVREAKPGRSVGDPQVGPVKYAWFSSPVFRRAVSHAIDRGAMIRGPLFGEGVKSWSTTTMGDKNWYTPDVAGADYDPEESRRLLASLGFRDRDGDGLLEDPAGKPVSFTLKTAAGNPPLIQMATLIQDDLAKVGIKCVPSVIDFGTLVTNLRFDFQYDAALLGYQSGVPPDPAMMQNIYRSSGSMHAWSILQPHPETSAEAGIDSLLAVNVSTDDMDTRKRTWSEIQKLFNRECFLVWLVTPRWKVPIRNRFGNVQPTAIPPRILWNLDRVFVKDAGTAGEPRR